MTSRRRVRLHRARRRAGRRARRRGRASRSRTRAGWRAPWRCSHEPARAGWSRCSTPSRCARPTAGRSRSAAIPSLELMERAGEGLARVIARHAPAGPHRGRLRQGQQRRRRPRRRAAAAPGRPRGRRPARLAARVSCSGDAAEQLRAAAGRRAGGRSSPARLDGAHGIVDALLGTGFSGAPRDPRDRRDRGDQRAPRAPVIAADVPTRRRRLDRRGRGRRRPRRRHGDVPPRQAGPVDPARQGARRRASTVIDIGIPARRARRARDRPDRRGRAARGPAPRGRTRPSSAPATCSSSAARAGSPARRRWPRWRRCAPARATSRSARPARSSRSFTVRLLEAMMVGLPEQDGALTAEAVEPALKAIRARRRGRARPGARPRARARRRSRASCAARRRAAGDRRRRPQRARRRISRTLAAAALADRPHAARGRARPAARLDSAEVGARAPRARARGGRARAARSSCSRATTRWSPRPTGRVRGLAAAARPALATAGTGDVLSGVIGAMLAKGLAPAHAACAAV